MSKYEEDNTYMDGEDKKPRLLMVLGIIILITIILVIIISCGMKSKKDNNANLSYLNITGGELSPVFSKSNFIYTISANSDVISVSCSPESSKAVTTNCNKRIDLASNIKSYQIIVTAQNGNTKTYTLNFLNKSSQTLSVSIDGSVANGDKTNEDVLLKAVVSLSDTQVSYQWYKDDTLLDGAVESSYNAKSSGNYYVRVTDSETKNSVDSENFIVNIERDVKNNNSTNSTNKSNSKSNNTKPNNNKNNNSNSSNNNKNNNNAKYTLVINNVSGNSNNFVKSVTLKVSASASNGLASNAYSFNGGKTYQSSNSKTFTKNQKVSIFVKDKKGNVTSKTVVINKVDNNNPNVSISASNKNNNSVTLTANTNPSSTPSGYKYQWYRNNSIIKGATSKTYKATYTGTYKVKVTTGVGYRKTSSGYSFTVVSMACPGFIPTTANGTWVNENTWMHEVIYIKIVPTYDTVSYDVYLNEDGKYDYVSRKYSYFNTFQGNVKIRLVNGGMRNMKVVIRDRNGNSATCYTKNYYLK